MKILKAASLGLLLLGTAPALATPAGTPNSNGAAQAAPAKPPKDHSAHHRPTTQPTTPRSN